MARSIPELSGGPPSSLAKMYPDIGRAGTPGAELIPELQGLGLVPRPQRGCRSFRVLVLLALHSARSL